MIYLHSPMLERVLSWYKVWQIRGQKWFTYFPLQRYLIAFLLFSFTAHLLLTAQIQPEPSAFNDLLVLMLKMVKTVILPLLLTGFLSVLIPFLLLWWSYRNRSLHVQLQSPSAQPDGYQQELHFSIQPLWQPIFGQVYYRLEYDKGRQRSPRFSLVRQENKWGYAGNHQQGWYRWPLPGIREYEVDTMVIYLEDFFHFFRLAIPVKVNQSFFTRPGYQTSRSGHIEPNKTLQHDTRIHDWRRVEGEWLHYKYFDSNDDVRRIVWKIYAKNKELVVRTPEILNPYASHISFYISFYDALSASASAAVSTTCLDYYKAACWNFYRNLKAQGLQTQFYTDQPATGITQEALAHPEEFALTISKWQHKVRPEEFIPARDATIVCISSLCNPRELAHLTAHAGAATLFAFVPLSQATPFPSGWDRLKWLWVETEKEPSYRVKLWWFLSPIRRRMIENEKRLQQILRDSGKKFVTIASSSKKA